MGVGRLKEQKRIPKSSRGLQEATNISSARITKEVGLSWLSV